MGEDLSIKTAAGNNVTFRDYTRKVETDVKPGDNGYLNFDGYLKLMVAQMSNQDFNDPMSDSEFIQQMASYSMMETIGKMNEQSQISYAASLVGKAVTVDNGATVDTGVVESVIIGDGKYELLINGSKYDTNAVKDIVDTNTYNTLTKAIGLQGTVNGKDEISGEVTNVLIRNGKGFVIINGNPYPFDSVKLAVPGDSEAEAGGDEGSEEGDAEDGESVIPPVEDGEEAIEEGGIAMQSANVGASKASMGLDDDSMWIFQQNVDKKLSEFYDENRQYMGKTNYEGVSGWSGELDNPNSTYGSYFEEDENDRALDPAELARLSGWDSAAAAAAVARTEQLDNGYYATKVEDVASSFSGTNNHTDEEGVTVRSAEASVSNARGINAASNSMTVYADDDDDDFDYDTEMTYGNSATPKLNSSNTITGAAKDPYHMYEDPGFAYGVDYGMTIGSNKAYANKGGWPPAPQNRPFGYLYPNEAIMANEKGTKMYDIRFIHNTAITKKIDTENVLGLTITGVPFTDIGYADMGRLGEVVTWADGRQRVEIISRTGSSWYTTSGEHTIYEICTSTDPYFVENLTLFEKTIRAASRETLAEVEARNRSDINSWMAQLARNSILEEDERQAAAAAAEAARKEKEKNSAADETGVPSIAAPDNSTSIPVLDDPDEAGISFSDSPDNSGAAASVTDTTEQSSETASGNTAAQTGMAGGANVADALFGDNNDDKEND